MERFFFLEVWQIATKVINPDDILSAFYARLNTDTGEGGFRSMVNSIDKGPKRRNGYSNPAATIHLLTMPIDAETDVYRSTAIVNIYVDDLSTGQAAAQALGGAAARVQWLFHGAHLPTHPAGPIQRSGIRFYEVYVSEPILPLPTDHEGEHLASVRIWMTVQAVPAS